MVRSVPPESTLPIVLITFIGISLSNKIGLSGPIPSYIVLCDTHLLDTSVSGLLFIINWKINMVNAMGSFVPVSG
jgi:hypothetical protein